MRKITSSGRDTTAFPSGPRPLVSGRRVIEVRDRQPVSYTSCTIRVIFGFNLRDIVVVRVIVRVQAGEEEMMESLGRIAVMIAAVIDLLEIGGIVEIVIELERRLQRLIGLAIQLMQPRVIRSDPTR